MDPVECSFPLGHTVHPNTDLRSRVPVNIPPEVRRESILDGGGHRGFGCSDMVLVAIPANELQQFLEVRHFNDTVAAECVELILGKPALTQVRHDAPGEIIGRDSAVRERSRTDAADDGSIGVFLAYSAGDDLLIIHLL